MSVEYIFRDKLEAFERKMCDKFVRVNKIRIGLSIQLLEEEQSLDSITRPHGNITINSYCKSIQVNKLDECNSFDDNAKIFVNGFKNNKEGILCICNANVTNVLLPFQFKNIESPIFYIFYGQFLLNQTPGVHSLKKDNICILDLNDAVDDFSEFKNFSKEFKAINKVTDYPNYVIKDEADTKISLIDYAALREIIMEVEFEFKKFIEPFFNKVEGKWVPDLVLKDFIDRIDLSVIKMNLKRLKQFIEKSKGISIRIKNDSSLIIEEMKKKLQQNKEHIESNRNGILKELFTWSTANRTGKVSTKEWFKFGNSLIKKCDEIT